MTSLAVVTVNVNATTTSTRATQQNNRAFKNKWELHQKLRLARVKIKTLLSIAVQW